MKKNICLIIAFLFAFQAVSLQYERLSVAGIHNKQEAVEFQNKINNRNNEIHLERYTESKKKVSIVFFESIVENIKPILHIKYKNVVSRVKFRPQSARMVVDEVQNFMLQKQNICSIIKTRNFVFC